MPPIAGRRRFDFFLLACLLAAPPLAAAAAWGGFGFTLVHPVRDAAWIALASVLEEFVFRGGLQQALLRRRALARPWGLPGLSLANGLTSLVFAAAHLWQHPALAALGVLPVSLVLGAAFERRGQRLAWPVALHLYFNAALCAATLAFSR